MNSFFKISDRIENTADKAMLLCKEQFDYIEDVTEYNQLKVQKAFIDNGISESHFISSTGYGYGDRGRETLDKVWAEVFGAEDALVRHNFTCGTHTLATALFGVLRPGDKMLCVTGTPYDTIHGVIGISGEGMGSLKDFGVEYNEVPLKDEKVDFDAIEKAVDDTTTMVYIQRSRGYELRASLSVDEIGRVCSIVKKKNPNVIVMVDNCYGEFVEASEPTQAGADLIIGSLIKNAGGAIAKTGGYIAGRRDLVELCSYRLTCVGMGKEVGCTLSQNREMFMGLFMAPDVTANAIKTADFASMLFSLLGFECSPSPEETRGDIITVLKLGNPELLTAFCCGIQKGAPVDSFITPEAWDMPGYDSKVIMAAGAFVAGSSIELSADGPIKPPYAVYFQGGLTWEHAQFGIMKTLQSVVDAGIVQI